MRCGYIISGVIAVAVTMAVFGCSKDKRVYTLDYQIKKLAGGEDMTPQQQAAMVFDTKDSDVRRTGIEMLLHKDWALREPYLKKFAALTDPAREKDPNVRAVAVRILGKAGDEKYCPEILRALYDPAAVVRWDGAVVIGRMPNEKAVTKLQRMAINDESADVRAAACLAIGHYRTDAVHRTLLRALDDDDFMVRDSANKALVRQTGQDRGPYPENWVDDHDKMGAETLPPPAVLYRKRPWWDWMKMTRESERVNRGKSERPWWDWFGVSSQRVDEFPVDTDTQPAR